MQGGVRDRRLAFGSSSLPPHEPKSYPNYSVDGVSLDLCSREEAPVVPSLVQLRDSSIHKDSQLLSIHQGTVYLALSKGGLYPKANPRPSSGQCQLSSVPCGVEPWPLRCVSSGIHHSLSPIPPVPWTPSSRELSLGHNRFPALRLASPGSSIHYSQHKMDF